MMPNFMVSMLVFGCPLFLELSELLKLEKTRKKMGLIEFFNDPNSAIIFGFGIVVSAVFLIGVTKSLYGPKK